jgi:glutamyl-tRNA reductase
MEKKFLEQQIFTKDIERLRKRIERLAPKIEKKQAKEIEKIIREEIKNYLKEIQKTPHFAPPTKVRDEAKEIEKFSKTEQVGALISLTFEKGLSYAVSVAKSLKNPAILDEFHDTLVDCYYEVLIKEGILKKI